MSRPLPSSSETKDIVGFDVDGLMGRSLRHRVGHSGTGPTSPASRSRLANIPAVSLSGGLNSTLIDRQNWMAVSENTAGRPGPSRRRSKPIPCWHRSAESPACAAVHCSWTILLCDSGRGIACSCNAWDGLASQSGSAVFRPVHQHHYRMGKFC